MKDKAEKNAGNPESIDLRRHRLPAQVRAKHAAEEREGKVRMVNLQANQEPERLLLLSAGKRSRSMERKKAREPHRREDHNNFLLITLAAPEQKPEPLFLRVCRASVSDANLLVVGKTFLIWPLFPLRDQTCSNWILSNVVPLFVN